MKFEKQYKKIGGGGQFDPVPPPSKYGKYQKMFGPDSVEETQVHNKRRLGCFKDISLTGQSYEGYRCGSNKPLAQWSGIRLCSNISESKTSVKSKSNL